MKNKIFFVLIIFVLSFASVFAIPQKQVEAVGFGLAIPGGVTLGAGTYALGALGLAGIVGLAGYAEYEEEINAHAKQVWEDGSQTAIDSLNASIDLAKGAGNGVVALQGDFIGFMEEKLQGINSKVASVSTDKIIAQDSMFVLSLTAGGTLLTLNNEQTTNGLSMMTRDELAGSVMIYYYRSSYRISYRGDTYTIDNYMADKGALYNKLKGMPYTTIPEFLAFLAAAGHSVQMVNANEYTNNYNSAVSKTKEAWEGMRDAGLVLPVDSAVPLSSVDGSPLTYNPTADNYTGIDGGVYEGTPAWAFPQPTIREHNPAIPNSVPTTGVYVDTPVLTGNPAYDDTIINNPAIPKTTTNVQTGVTVGNPDIAITEPVPPVDGGGGTPPEDGASCAKLKMPIFSPLKEQFSISFPFSIPWDIGRAINAAFSEIGDEKPEFKLDLKLMDKKHTINITLPKMFDDWKPFTDSLLLFIFDVLIMFGIYRFVKGAGS